MGLRDLRGSSSGGSGSEFKVPAAGFTTRSAVGSGRREQACDSAQIIPSSFIQRGVGTDQITQHLPGSHVQCPLRGRPHRQRDRTLRAETDSLRCRLLPRTDADGLGKHVHGYRFASRLDLAAAAKTTKVFHALKVTNTAFRPQCTSTQPDSRETRTIVSSSQKRLPSCTLLAWLARQKPSGASMSSIPEQRRHGQPRNSSAWRSFAA